MKNLFKHLAAWAVLFGIIWLGSGCTTTPTVTVIPKKVVSFKQDLLAKTIVNKEKSRLQKMLAEILNGGEIITIKIKSKRWANGIETSKETWIVENSKNDRFIVVWENGVLLTIDDIEKVEKEKPLGG